MNKPTNTPFTITEWDWLKTQMNIFSLQSKGNLISFSYQFDDNNASVACSIHFKTDQLPKDKESKDRFINSAQSFIQVERFKLEKILNNLPVLKSWFDIDKHVTFNLLNDYGTGSALMGTVRDTEVKWVLNL